MVEYVCEKMDRCSFENQEETVTRNTEEEDKEEAKAEIEEEVNTSSDVKQTEEQMVEKYESVGKSGDESDFSDRNGFLHIRGPDLIAFEMVEPSQEENFENAEGWCLKLIRVMVFNATFSNISGLVWYV
jgi:hypothetical protein